MKEKEHFKKQKKTKQSVNNPLKLRFLAPPKWFQLQTSL